MNRTTVLALAVLAASTGGISGSSCLLAADPPATTRPTETQLSAMRDAIRELQLARVHLTNARREFAGYRARALEQTDYAIIQGYAAIGDDSGMKKDRDTSEALVKGSDKRHENDKHDKTGQHKAMTAALQRLQKGRELLLKTSSSQFGEHRQKALQFVDLAIADVQKALADAGSTAK